MTKPDLTQTQRTMHSLLRGETSPEAAAAALGAGPVRVAAYQRFVFAHIRDVLEKNFTVLPGVLGGAHWLAVVQGFFAACPPQDYELNACSAGLPDYIAARLPSDPALTPFHVELARLEWLEAQVALAPDAPPVRVPGAPVLNPVLVAARFTYPVTAFAAAYRAGIRPQPPPPQDELAFIYRHPVTGGFVSLVPDAAMLLAFKAANDGLPVAEVAQAAGITGADLRVVLLRALDAGLLLETEAPRGASVEPEESS